MIFTSVYDSLTVKLSLHVLSIKICCGRPLNNQPAACMANVQQAPRLNPNNYRKTLDFHMDVEGCQWINVK